MKRLSKILVLFSTLLVLDILSKILVVKFVAIHPWSTPFYPYGGIGVFQNLLGIDFSINYVMNRGSAWGMFADWHFALLAVRIGAIISLVVYLLKFCEDRSRDIPLALIITGAFGNVVDCFIYKHVIDMFHFNVWGWNCPVFNIADACIFFGVSIMLIQSSFGKRKHEVTPQE
jgi:signal peptidase II